MTSAISDTEPSPWVACPFCGEIWLRLVAVLERGNWVETLDGHEHYALDFGTPPKIGGYRSSSPEIECTRCLKGFGLADVGYNTEETDPRSAV